MSDWLVAYFVPLGCVLFTSLVAYAACWADGTSRRWPARFALASPLWPLLLVLGVVVGVFRLVRDLTRDAGGGGS